MAGGGGAAAGQLHTDESLGITVRLCQEFGAGQNLFCSVRAAGLVTEMLENKKYIKNISGFLLRRTRLGNR